MRGLVWVEAIFHLEGEGVGRLLRQVGQGDTRVRAHQDLELLEAETGLDDVEGEDGQGVVQHGLHGAGLSLCSSVKRALVFTEIVWTPMVISDLTQL